MFNHYTIDGKSARVKVRHRHEPDDEFLIDVEDLPKLEGFYWQVQADGVVRGCGTVGGGHEDERLNLRKLVLGIDQNESVIIRHKNGKTRDCRKSNLLVKQAGVPVIDSKRYEGSVKIHPALLDQAPKPTVKPMSLAETLRLLADHIEAMEVQK